MVENGDDGSNGMNGFAWELESCGNCTRTKKRCTFEWLKSQEPALKTRKHPKVPEQDRSFKRTKLDRLTVNDEESISVSPEDDFWCAIECPTRSSGGTSISKSMSSNGLPSDMYSLPPLHDGTESHVLTMDISPHQVLVGDATCAFGDFLEPGSGHYDAPLTTSTFVTSRDFDLPAEGFLEPSNEFVGGTWCEGGGSDFMHLIPRPKQPASLVSILSPDEETEEHQDNSHPKVNFAFGPSPMSLSERLSKTTNHAILTENLMKVYHDSMENALSCWLNERTCPYRGLVIANTADFGESSLHREWGPDWSNRIFRRVFSLDRMAGKIRDKPLSRSEEAATTRALYLVIMAFATQWAQASKRSRDQHLPGRRSLRKTSNPEPGIEIVCSDELEFDRIIQDAYWREARRALLDCADVESFKVSFANIIFSLTQKPMTQEQQADLRQAHGSHTDQMSIIPGDFRQVLSRVENLMDEDGPPIHLEQGVRIVHSLRHRLQRRERALEKSSQTIGQATILSHEDRRAVDLIAWLGYMLESLTSAMHQRPLVVADKDCDVLPESIEALNLSDERDTACRRVTAKPGASRLWNDYFFLQEQSNRRGAVLRWPCSYEDAAAGLTDAAPIKVLLYRKVTLLQTLFTRRENSERIEDAIQESLTVYDHWKATYEPFFRDCINHHDSLPDRIQSWYICLTGHWHLATLLLADIIESIDESKLGLDTHYLLRSSANLVQNLRRYNSHVVSDLARCATPRDDATFPQSKHFHFALNEGALLTEPWTAILIRVFAKSAILLMEEAWNVLKHSSVDGGWAAELVQQRSEDCVRALKYLGKKSDCARMVGDTLADTLLVSFGNNWNTEGMVTMNTRDIWEPGLYDDNSFVLENLGFGATNFV
jgi:hypothetical protein